MEIFSNSALTALFVGVVLALVRVVDYFIGKKNNNGHKYLSNEQEEMLCEINENTKELTKMHEVFDENHTPLWYFPREIISATKEIHGEIQNIDEIKSGQTVLVEKISELIMSQKLLTERLGDLINKLDKSFRN